GGAAGSIRESLYRPRDHPAALHFELAIADLAQNLAAGANGQTLTHHQIAVEAAGNIGGFNFGRAAEFAGTGNIHGAAIGQHSLDLAFDDETVAGTDLA